MFAEEPYRLWGHLSGPAQSAVVLHESPHCSAPPLTGRPLNSVQPRWSSLKALFCAARAHCAPARAWHRYEVTAEGQKPLLCHPFQLSKTETGRLHCLLLISSAFYWSDMSPSVWRIIVYLLLPWNQIIFCRWKNKWKKWIRVWGIISFYSEFSLFSASNMWLFGNLHDGWSLCEPSEASCSFMRIQWQTSVAADQFPFTAVSQRFMVKHSKEGILKFESFWLKLNQDIVFLWFVLSN